MPTKKILAFIIALVIAVVAAWWWRNDLQFRYYAAKTDQDIAKVKDYYQQAQEWKAKTKEQSNPPSPDGSGPSALDSSDEAGEARFDYVIEEARAYEYMGNISKAISIYKAYAPDETTAEFFVYHSNLAKLYEKQDRWQTAIGHYLKITEKFADAYPEVYLDLARAELEDGDKTAAQEYYFKFKALSGRVDEAFELRLK